MKVGLSRRDDLRIISRSFYQNDPTPHAHHPLVVLSKRPYPFVPESANFPLLSKQTSESVVSQWFRASEAVGDFMDIRYGRVPDGTGDVEWHFVSHIECDGIGGFARLLRERGVEVGKLPETKHPCCGLILPLWNFIRECRSEEGGALRGDWQVPDQAIAGISEAVDWHLFTVEETSNMLAFCRERGVTVNSFLLKHLDHAVRSGIGKPEAKIPWLIPVNLRGNVQNEDDTANHVSGIEVYIAQNESPESIHSQILRRLNLGEHRAKQLLMMIGTIMSHTAKVKLLLKDCTKATGNIGTFSNLGVWDFGKNIESGDGWLFCPPVVYGQLLGAGCVTFQGRLGLTIQGHASLSSTPEVAKEWMSRWLEGIRGVC